ncbi:NADPH-dependent FMN reductase [uncultured Croceitalea sp.]|uniref:NADPH-dependent FMN reductase n=1 Tax=uncultured Croceitalea sp. TaxID=1798908 RepID=UPI00374FA573
MANILAFAGSNSSVYINYQLVKYTVSLIENHQVQLINMANLPFPMYSEDYEKKNGYSNSLIELKNDIGSADGLVLSVSEHNSNPSAFFKNVLDWLSRIDRNFLQETKVLLMSTSPGKGGAKYSLEVTNKVLPRFGAEIIESFSLPSFSENFDKEKGILDSDLSKKHETAVKSFLSSF